MKLKNPPTYLSSKNKKDTTGMEAPGDGFLLIPFFPKIIFRYSEAKIEGKLDRNGRLNPSLNFLACLVLFS